MYWLPYFQQLFFRPKYIQQFVQEILPTNLLPTNILVNLNEVDFGGNEQLEKMRLDPYRGMDYGEIDTI